jgi:serine protease Do
MPFPIEPLDGRVDERGLFVVQDPALLARVLPLFRFDPRSPGDRPEGHGTAFRIDLWSRCLTPGTSSRIFSSQAPAMT